MTILFWDDFGPIASGTTLNYTLSDAQVSPNGLWKCIYNGYGIVGAQQIPAPQNGRPGNCMLLRPQTNESGTSASLVLSQQEFTDFDTTFYMRTFKHTRSNPNNWETFWFMFRYTDNTHHYYFYIAKNGMVEIGKKDHIIVNSTTLQTPDGVNHTVTNTDRQQFLFTQNNAVVFALQKWFKVRLIVQAYHIKLYIDDNLIADITDDGTIGTDGITGQPLRWKPSSQISHGKLGGYVEDAEGHLDNVLVNSV